MSTYPNRVNEFVMSLLHNGWTFAVKPNVDTGDSPYVTIEALKPDRARMILTWHTRGTGTYRLFSCRIDKKDSTLTQAVKEVRK